MSDHDSKHIQDVVWQEHRALVTFFGRKALFEYSQDLIVNMACHEHFLDLAEIRTVPLLHYEPERHVYARDDKGCMTKRYCFNEGDQFRVGRLAIKYIGIGKNHAGDH
jgi:hypothetical protein